MTTAKLVIDKKRHGLILPTIALILLVLETIHNSGIGAIVCAPPGSVRAMRGGFYWKILTLTHKMGYIGDDKCQMANGKRNSNDKCQIAYLPVTVQSS